MKSLGSSAGREVEFEVGRGYKSQRSSLSSTEQPLSLTYTLTNTRGKSLIQTQVTRQTRSQDWDRQTTKGCFLHPLRYAHAHGVTPALAHANTTSNSQRLIEVSALLIVFVHLGMKEPF